jgi:hypothetical protein
MPLAARETAGLFIMAALVLLAGWFTGRQWLDHVRRDSDDTGVSEDDRRHFAHQNLRRGLGSVVMVAIACGMGYGLWIDPRADRAAFRIWLVTWGGVTLLVGVLLVLAILDWLATFAYAGRHRRALIRERTEILEAELLRRTNRTGERPGTATEGPEPS